MLFEIAKNSFFLQQTIIRLLKAVHPSIEHNLGKIEMLKKAFFHCHLEKIRGNYLEFGIYEGTSLYAALQLSLGLDRKEPRKFFGFDSFDEGFKYFDQKDRHPFFKEGDFVSSYEKTRRRFRAFSQVQLVKGYFEKTLNDKKVLAQFQGEKTAVLFIDCDLMNPAFLALEKTRVTLQPGTVLILDDFWAYRGNPELGTAGALKRFLKKFPRIQVRPYFHYGMGGTSFIVTRV